MIGVTLRGLLARWRRAALTGVAAVVGVAIVAGTLMVSDTADRAGAAGGDLDVIRKVMLLAGGVALLVGAFIVNITTSVTVAQRVRELGLLRCLGADRKQLRRSVLLESLVVGLTAAVVGLALGYGVAAVLRRLLNTGLFSGNLPGHSFVISLRTVVAALFVGCLVGVLSALAPARRAGKVPPVAALQDMPPVAGGVRAWRVVCGGLTLVAGLALLPIAVATWRGPLLFPAAALTLVGVRLLGPVFAGRLARAVGLPVAGAFGVSGSLGRHNAARSPDRTAATASALMIGVALLTFLNVLFASTEAPMLAASRRGHVDFQVWMAAEDQTVGRPPPVDPAVLARLRSRPELAAVVPVDCVGDPAKGGEICAADPSSLTRVLDVDVVAGSLADLATGGVGLDDATAAAGGTGVGSTLRLGASSFTVKAVYRRSTNFGDYLLTPPEFARVGGNPGTTRALLRVADGVETGAARAAVVTAVAAYPKIEIIDRDGSSQQDLAQIRGVVSIYRALTGLAALIGLFGVASTLALSIVERRRELGLLRAVGMQRRQLRAMVRAEAVIVTLVGAVLGVAVGVLFGWAGARVLAHSSSPTTCTMPYAVIAATTVLVALAGLVAATVPARLAGRVDLLRAVAAE